MYRQLLRPSLRGHYYICRLRLKRDATPADFRFRLLANWMIPFNSAGASFQSTTGSRNVGISGSNAGYTMFRGSVKSTGYPFNSPVSPSLPLPCVTVCHHISLGLYLCIFVKIVSPWRWEQQRPKHVGENLVNKMYHKLWSALCSSFVYYGTNISLIKTISACL